jgi:hypothetical protein
VDDPVARLASYYSQEAEVWERRLAALLHPLGDAAFGACPARPARHAWLPPATSWLSSTPETFVDPQEAVLAWARRPA